MIDHISLRVSDFPRSLSFYKAALAPLGYEVVMEFPGMAGLGARRKPDFWLTATDKPVNPTHIAFAADRGQVDAFHAAAVIAGGRDDGAPGLRAVYHPHYYGAFVRDPDGNSVEAVCHHPDGGVKQAKKLEKRERKARKAAAKAAKKLAKADKGAGATRAKARLVAGESASRDVKKRQPEKAAHTAPKSVLVKGKNKGGGKAKSQARDQGKVKVKVKKKGATVKVKKAERKPDTSKVDAKGKAAAKRAGGKKR